MLGDKQELKKVGAGYRILSAFISFLSVLGVIAGIDLISEEGVDVLFVVIGAMPWILLYICVPVTFTGYPPKLFWWALEKK